MLGRLKLWAEMVASFAVALVRVFLWGKSKLAAQQKAKDLRTYKNTRKDIDHADDLNNPATAAKCLSNVN